MSIWRNMVVVVVLLVAALDGAVACRPERIVERIHFESVADVTHLSTSGANLYLVLQNDNCHRIVVSDAEFDIVSHGEVIATISLRDKVVLRRRSVGEVLVPLRFKSRSSFVLGRLVVRMLDPTSNLTIDYRLRGGVGPFRTTVAEEGVPIGEFLDSFGIGEALLEELNLLTR